MSFPINSVRACFPALHVEDAGRPRVYFDAPGGTQACRHAIARMAAHLEGGTANAGGVVATSIETDTLSEAAHVALADLLGAQPRETAFGPNMTSLTLSVSRALARGWSAGDEIVLTRLDHDANIAPWLLVARDDGRLRLDALPALLGPRTKLVAVGGASNALGTLNDIPAIVAAIRARSSALVFVDAVQSVPHVATDVTALGCDLLVCSPYKFFGPHAGVLWGRAALLETLDAYKVRPASIDPAAVRFETGTPSFEAQAGMLGTIEYLDWLGGEIAPEVTGRRARLRAAMEGAGEYERGLATVRPFTTLWPSAASPNACSRASRRSTGCACGDRPAPRIACRPSPSPSPAATRMRSPRTCHATASSRGRDISMRSRSSSGSGWRIAAASCASGCATTTRARKSIG